MRPSLVAPLSLPLPRVVVVVLLVPWLVSVWAVDKFHDVPWPGSAWTDESFADEWLRAQRAAWRDEEIRQGMPVFEETAAQTGGDFIDAAVPPERAECHDHNCDEESQLLAWGTLEHGYRAWHKRPGFSPLVRIGPKPGQVVAIAREFFP